MKLIEFRIRNFRSVNDSGLIEVRDQTALVGRNESGKTNLLLALQSLNPPTRVMEALSDVKDFPRDRPLSQYNPDVPVVDTKWELSNEEQKYLGKLFPRAKAIIQVTVNRYYKPGTRSVGFVGLPLLTVNSQEVKQISTKLSQGIRRSLQKNSEVEMKGVEALDSLLSVMDETTLEPDEWAAATWKALQEFKEVFSGLGVSFTDTINGHLETLTNYIGNIQNDDEAHAKARTWVVKDLLPIFIFLDEYPELDGHQSIDQYVQGKNEKRPLTEAEKNFEKLLKVAGLDAVQLQTLLGQDHEKRQQMANRAGAVVTSKIRELWTDRELKVRFNLDADHFDTLISDPTSIYDVEINLNERSRGFKWFFSFYVTFAADTAGGPAENAILLLDEPGLFLHATAQNDLLTHFAEDFKNQVVYTTHSPFMVPVNDIAAVRTVNIDPTTGTTVTNDPTGDERTLFPLRTAIGYELTQSLFIGENNLVVEGISDFWYLSSISEYLQDVGGAGLPTDLVITPAGGAQKISYMVSLLTAHQLRVIVLFDEEKNARNTAQELVKLKLIRKEHVVFISEAFSGGIAEADIEDLLDPDIFDALVAETYKKELSGKTLVLNPKIPRIVIRYEKAFEALGLEFHKTRPAKLFLRRIADDPASVMMSTVAECFSTLFDVIEKRQQAIIAAARKPFQ